MAITYVQGKLAVIKISVDAGVTKKNITCNQTWEFNGTTPVNKESSDCGTATGLGSNEWSIPFSGLVNITPTGASEVSYEDLLGIWNAQTLFQVYLPYPDPAGTDWYMSGDVYLTELTLTKATEELMKFSGTLTGSSALDITP